jgi:hypothetical protein
LNWARALVKLNAKNLDKETFENTKTVLLKHESDIIRAQRALARRGPNGGRNRPGDFDPDDFTHYRNILDR